MKEEKFAVEVKKAFGAVHKDMQNLKGLFDKLNKKVDLIGEQVDMMKNKLVTMSDGEEEGDVPPEAPESEEEESGSSFYR